MSGKSLNFELEDGDSVTMTLSDSARISLTDITVATIGNLAEDSQWEDNSVPDSGAPVLRPWEDNSNSDKSDMITQNEVYERRQPPPSYKEHLKRRLDSDETEEVHDVTKRIKIQTSDIIKDATTIPKFAAPLRDSTLHDTSHMKNVQAPGYDTIHTIVSAGTVHNYQQNYETQNSNQDVGSHGNMLGRSLYSSLIDLSTTNEMQNSSTQSSMPNSSTQNSTQSVPTLISIQCLPSKTSFQSSSSQDLLPSLSNWNATKSIYTGNSEQSMSSKNSTQSSSMQNLLPELPTHSSLQSLPNLIPVQRWTTKNSMQGITSMHTTQSSSMQNLLPSVSTNNLWQSLPTLIPMQKLSTPDLLPGFSHQIPNIMQLTNNQIPTSDTQNSQPNVIDKNLIPNNETINSLSSASNVNYFPWENTLPLKENKTFDRNRQQMTTESSNLSTADSSMRSKQVQYPFKPEPRPLVPNQIKYASSVQPTTENLQMSSISCEENAEKQDYGQDMIKYQQPNTSVQHLQSLVPHYLQMSDIPQTKTNTSQEYTPMQQSWQQTLASLQTNSIDQSQSYVKHEPATPVGKGQMINSSYDSPGFDSRFTESLSNLLGSPPPDSPLSKNPVLGDLQALLNRECKREIVPQTLFSIQNSNKTSAEKKPLNVFERERNLQERFTKLQSSHSEDIRQLSSMFRYQSALIETERFRTLHECQYPGSYKESVNHHYDNQLHKVMDRVERSVELLENSNKENRANKIPKMRPHLNKEAIRLMEHWYSQNLDHPYPTSSSIEMLAQAGNIGIEQVKKWFANKRNRNSNTRSLTEIAMQKRKLGQMLGQS